MAGMQAERTATWESAFLLALYTTLLAPRPIFSMKSKSARVDMPKGTVYGGGVSGSKWRSRPVVSLNGDM